MCICAHVLCTFQVILVYLLHFVGNALVVTTHLFDAHSHTHTQIQAHTMYLAPLLLWVFAQIVLNTSRITFAYMSACDMHTNRYLHSLWMAVESLTDEGGQTKALRDIMLCLFKLQGKILISYSYLILISEHFRVKLSWDLKSWKYYTQYPKSFQQLAVVLWVPKLDILSS